MRAACSVITSHIAPSVQPASLTPPRRLSQPGHRDALFIGNIEMRILSKRQLKELVLYSPQHVARLERAGQFPKRVQLGPSRVGWVEAEVLDWLQQRLANRDMPSRHSS
jgi:prophage regulatory protein